MNSIKKIENNQKPRERLILNGARSLSNSEILQILISSGNKQNDCLTICNNLLNYICNFSNLSKITYEELITFNGIKQSKACIILAAVELAKRIFLTGTTFYLDKKIKTLDEIVKITIPIFSSLDYEKLIVAYLNISSKIIKIEEISSSNTNMISLDIKQLCINSLKTGAYAAIFIHNHPSGDESPSTNDIKTTYAIESAFDTIGIKLLDHLIIGKNNFYSIKQKERLKITY